MKAQDEEKRRRGPLRFLFRGGLGLVAVCLGALFMLVLLLPTLASPLAGGFLTGYLDKRYEGSFEIADARLGWFGRQSLEGVRVSDPDGGEVGVFSVHMPSLVDLIRGKGRDFGFVEVEARLALSADDEGVSNLERCLAPVTTPATEQPSRRSGDGRRPQPSPRPELALELDLDCKQLSWSDAHTRASGAPFTLKDVRGHAQLAPGQPLELTLEGDVQASTPGVLRATARVDDPFRITDTENPTGFRVDCEVSGLPTALVDTLAGQGGRLTRMLGPDFRFAASGEGTSADGELSFELLSDHLQVAFAGRVADGVLACDVERGASLALDLGPEWVDDLTAELLAPPHAGEAVQAQAGAVEAPSLFPHPGQRLELEISELGLPVAPLFAPPSERGDLVGALLRGLTVRARLRAGDWTWRAVDLRRLQVLGLGADLNVLPGNESGAKPFELLLFASLSEGASDDPPPNVELTVAGGDLTMLAAWRPGDALVPVHTGGAVRELDSAFVDRWLPGADLGAQGAVTSCDFTVDLVQPAGGALEARFAAGLVTGLGQSRIAGDARIADPLALAPAGLAPFSGWPEVTAAAELSGLAPLLALLPEPRRASLAPLLGERVSLQAVHTGSAPRSGALELRVEGAAFGLDVDARIEDNTLRIERGGRMDAWVAPPDDLVASLVAESLPAGTRMAFPAGERVRIACSELALDLSPWLAPEPEPGEPALTRLLTTLEGLVTLTAPGFSFTPAPPPAPATGEAAAQKPIQLRDSTLALRFAAGEPAAARLTGAVDATPPGTIELDVTLHDLPGAVAAGSAPRMHLAGTITSMPTAVVDTLAAQDGLLVDVLGDTLDLVLSGAWPTVADRPLAVRMTSSKASLDLTASLDEGLLLSGPDGSIDASVGLTPLFSERVVGRLMPMLVGISKPEGADPSVFEVRSFALPLDGDVKKLSGRIQVSLGEVSYDLLPGLDGLVSKLSGGGKGGREQKGARGSTRIRPFELVVDKGVVQVDSLPLVVGGQELPFKGRYNLNGQRFNLTTELPLSLLGQGVESKLDAVREYLDPDTKVPIQLKGTFTSPRIKLGEDFLKEVVDGAAKQALGRGLGGLLDKLKKDG